MYYLPTFNFFSFGRICYTTIQPSDFQLTNVDTKALSKANKVNIVSKNSRICYIN